MHALAGARRPPLCPCRRVTLGDRSPAPLASPVHSQTRPRPSVVLLPPATGGRHPNICFALPLRKARTALIRAFDLQRRVPSDQSSVPAPCPPPPHDMLKRFLSDGSRFPASDLSSCDGAPLGKSGLGSGVPDLLRAPECLADELPAAGAPCGDRPAPICSLPLKRTELMCSNPSPDAPVHAPFHLHSSLAPSRRRRSVLLNQSLSVCRLLPRIRTSFSHLAALPAPPPSPPSAAPSCHRRHFSSPEAHSRVRGNVWLYLYDADTLLDSYCFGAELPHSKFIKGQFNSKFMKWASVTELLVCSQGASRTLALTLLPFPALIGISWVVSLGPIPKISQFTAVSAPPSPATINVGRASALFRGS